MWSRKARKPACSAGGRDQSIGRPSATTPSTASASARRLPSSRTRTPGMPCAAWAIIPSRRERTGSCGAAGSSGVASRTSALASAGSSWGRLPIEVATPVDSARVTLRSLLGFLSRGAAVLLDGGDDDGGAVLEGFENFFGGGPLLAGGGRVALDHRQVDEAHLCCHRLSFGGRCKNDAAASSPPSSPDPADAGDRRGISPYSPPPCCPQRSVGPIRGSCACGGPLSRSPQAR